MAGTAHRLFGYLTSIHCLKLPMNHRDIVGQGIGVIAKVHSSTRRIVIYPPRAVPEYTLYRSPAYW